MLDLFNLQFFGSGEALAGTEMPGSGGGGVGGGRVPNTALYTVTTKVTTELRWAAIENHFNVSFIMRDKVMRQSP